jgi:hypothetical protein
MDEKPVSADDEKDENDIDGCGVPVEHETADEDLPETKGGVA